jgi:hypothetical protein
VVLNLAASCHAPQFMELPLQIPDADLATARQRVLRRARQPATAARPAEDRDRVVGRDRRDRLVHQPRSRRVVGLVGSGKP